MYLCNQAAQFGKGFIPHLNSDSYVEMCRLLRVLNAVRDHKIGIPLTCTQYPFIGFLVFNTTWTFTRDRTGKKYYTFII